MLGDSAVVVRKNVSIYTPGDDLLAGRNVFSALC